MPVITLEDVEAAAAQLAELEADVQNPPVTKDTETKTAADVDKSVVSDAVAEDKKPDVQNPPVETPSGEATTVVDFMTEADVLDLLGSLGIKAEEAKSLGFGSKEELLRAQAIADRSLLRTFREQQAPSTTTTVATPATAEVAKPADPVPSPERARDPETGRFVKAEDLAPYKPSIGSEDAIDPAMLKELEGLGGHVSKQLEMVARVVQERLEKEVGPLKALLEQERQRVKLQQEFDFYRRFDEMVDALGQDELFGKTADLRDPQTGAFKDEKSPLAVNRKTLLPEVIDLLRIKGLRGQTAEVDQETVRRAFHATFFEKAFTAFRQNLSKQLLRGMGQVSAATGKHVPVSGSAPGKPSDLPAYEDPQVIDEINRLRGRL